MAARGAARRDRHEEGGRRWREAELLCVTVRHSALRAIGDFCDSAAPTIACSTKLGPQHFSQSSSMKSCQQATAARAGHSMRTHVHVYMQGLRGKHVT